MISVRHGVQIVVHWTLHDISKTWGADMQIVVHWTLHDISKTWGADSGSLDPT